MDDDDQLLSNLGGPQAPRRLRVGLLVDSFQLDAWMARIVASIQRSESAEIVLVVENDAEVQAHYSAFRKLRERPDLFLYFLYQAADTYLFGQRLDGTGRLHARGEVPLENPFALVDIRPLVAGAGHMVIRPKQTRFSDYLSEEDLQKIREYDLDVAFRFGFRILRGGALDIAREGVWSYHHDDNYRVRGGPAGFWEVFERTPVTGAILQRLTEDVDNGVVLYSSHSTTDPFSVARNRANYFFTSSEFAMRALEGIHARESDDGADGTAPLATRFQPYNYPLYVRPKNAQMARLLVRQGTALARGAINRVVAPERWTLAYDLRLGPPAMYRFRPLTPPAESLWADPFPLARKGRFYIFFEEKLSSAPFGHISVIEMDEKGNPSPPVSVLERPHHLSYPFIFDWNDDLYMVPESGETGRVEIYRCAEFPHRWELEGVLLEGVVAADATLAEVDGRWWMFVVIAVEGTRNFNELHLYTADNPLGPWRPHRANPVKSDSRSSRPAGRLFWWRGRLLRPVQDCGGRYGRAVSIQEVCHLDEHSFDEKEMSRIEPYWNRRVVAVHTFNMVDGLTVIDTLVKEPRLSRASR